ncbi:MAG TPA: serine/threonine-protein kinase [Polyangiaceae bacterium]
MIDDLESRARERVGVVLGDKWTLERLIGVGGMAAVYAAKHRNGAKAAVKVLHPDLARHKEVRERFLREGYAANRVDHPGVVKVLDDDVVAEGEDAGTAYIVMELLEGESLQDRLERGPPMGERDFLTIAAVVLEVLEAAHTNSVVHRDLKPENLFLVKGEGTQSPVKVLDFGLARLLDGQTITSYGLALGTPSFMSPEQAAGRIDEIDGRTDLFALAATGFRLRTGRRIHEGANPVELVTKMANFAAPKIRTLAPETSAPFARVIDRALEFKRDDRYANAKAMRDDVKRAVAELDGGHARTELAMEPPASLKPASVPPPISVKPPPPPPPAEPTMELSESDLERSKASTSMSTSTVESSLPVVTPLPRRKRRSLLPWVTLLFFVGLGGKLWLDARQPSNEVTSAVATAAAKPTTTATPSAIPSATATATPSATPTPTPTATATAPPALRPTTATSAMAPRVSSPPARLGPGNVHHVGPSKRRKSSR